MVRDNKRNEYDGIDEAGEESLPKSLISRRDIHFFSERRVLLRLTGGEASTVG
jgi:hypothetical protein